MMGYLKKKRVYLTGSISDAKDAGIGWRKIITPRLKQFGLIVDDPTKKTASNNRGEVGKDKEYFAKLIKQRKFEKVKDAFWPIVRQDLRSVDLADFIIWHWNPEERLLGTIHELVIGHAIEKKPVLLHVDDHLVEKINPWGLVFVKKGCLFTDWSKMYKYLEDINKGKFNTSYWTLG